MLLYFYLFLYYILINKLLLFIDKKLSIIIIQKFIDKSIIY